MTAVASIIRTLPALLLALAACAPGVAVAHGGHPHRIAAPVEQKIVPAAPVSSRAAQQPARAAAQVRPSCPGGSGPGCCCYDSPGSVGDGRTPAAAPAAVAITWPHELIPLPSSAPHAVPASVPVLSAQPRAPPLFS